MHPKKLELNSFKKKEARTLDGRHEIVRTGYADYISQIRIVRTKSA